MDNKSSLTALISMFGRAYHSENDKPIIFNDDISRKLMTEEEYKQIEKYMIGGIDFFAPNERFTSEDAALKHIVQMQIAPTPIARSRCCEDALSTAVLTGTEQYVILGAGMDTFAYRSPDLMKRLKVFELDYPLTQEDKKRRVAAARLEMPDTLTLVPVDFTKDNLADTLLKHGYDSTKKTFFSWLGVSYYLEKPVIKKMLLEISSLASRGSSLFFDYADEKLFSSDVGRVRKMLQMAEVSSEPMKTCFSYKDLELTLEECGFLIYEHLNTEDIQGRYFGGRDDYLSAFEHINYVLAAVRQ